MFDSRDNPGEIAGMLVGTSRGVQELRQEAALASRVDVRVLLSGEYGVGKRRLARLIHQQSARAGSAFEAVRCREVSDGQMGIRLFGDAPGAPGVFERADGGTVFLQDIDALSLGLQARLVRFLESGEIQVGPDRTRRVNVRLICATTTRFRESGSANTLLADLYYLLNTVYIPVPALRERAEDVEPLLEFFTAYYARRCGIRVPELSTESKADCRSHDWPANLRQLQAAAAMFVLPMPPARPVDILESAARLARSQRPFIGL